MSIKRELVGPTRQGGFIGIRRALLLRRRQGPSLNIDFSTGSGLASLIAFTYTRATSATITDFEGLIKSCLSGELRIYGARRVRNLITTPDLSNAAWSKEQGGTGSAPTLTYGQTDPNGGTTATRAQLNRGAGNTASDYSGVYFRAIASGATTTAVGRVAIKSNTGSSQTFTLKLDATSQVQLTATTSWQTFSVSRTQSGNQDFEILSWGQNAGSTNSLDLLVAFPQCENITGQSNQNPSEYVSVGVLSSPFHGYFVDGVKYFSYENGNTVSSNVVTEAQGPAITGTIGYLVEGQRTNLCLQSNSFTTTWTQLNAGDVFAGGQSGAPDGTATGWKIIAGGAGSTGHGPRQSITLTAATYTMWAIAKAGTAGYYLELFNGNATAFATFNLTTGVVGGASNCTSKITAMEDGWYLCEATFTGTAAAGNFDVRITNSLTVNQSYVGDGTSYINVWVAQMELGAFASTYIGHTTTAAVTRNADVLTCPFAGIGNDTQGAAYIEAMTFSTTGNGFSTIPLAFSSNGSLLYLNSGDARTAINSFDGTTVVTKTGLTDISTALRKRACSWGSGGMSITGDGAVPETSVFDGSLGSTSITIGAATGGTSQWFGVIKTVRVYRTKLSDAQLASMTA